MKKSTYKKYWLIIILCTVSGGLLGFLLHWFNREGSARGMEMFLELIRDFQLPVLAVIAVAGIAGGELALGRIRRAGRKMENAQDEECDILEYDIERTGNMGVIGYNLIIILSLLVISITYSMDYMEAQGKGKINYLLAGMVVFLISVIYEGLWNVRYVKLLQKIYPQKKGDPSSLRFQEQWLESCDEAEKEVVYQSCYRTYLVAMKVLPMLLALTMLSHLIWNTGIMAVFVVGVVWIALTVTYTYNCSVKRARKLRRD